MLINKKAETTANTSANASSLKKYLGIACSRMFVTGFGPYLCRASFSTHSNTKIFFPPIVYSLFLDSDNLRY